MAKKVFIDGKAGTTGLRIYERLETFQGIELITLDDEKRKDPECRKEALNSADIAFLCLPDDAARESVSLIENDNTVVIDTSTAHRTADGWLYGFPEISESFFQKAGDDYTELSVTTELCQDIQKFLPSFFQKAGYQ